MRHVLTRVAQQQEERETGEGGEGYVRDEGEATVWAVRGRGAGGGKRSEQFEVLSPGNQFRRGLRSNLLQQQQLHPANVHYEQQYHEVCILSSTHLPSSFTHPSMRVSYE
jgi:hypothetical protein